MFIATEMIVAEPSASLGHGTGHNLSIKGNVNIKSSPRNVSLHIAQFPYTCDTQSSRCLLHAWELVDLSVLLDLYAYAEN